MLTSSSDSRHTVNGTDSESFVSVARTSNNKIHQIMVFPNNKKQNQQRKTQNIQIYDMEYALLPDLIIDLI